MSKDVNAQGFKNFNGMLKDSDFGKDNEIILSHLSDEIDNALQPDDKKFLDELEALKINPFEDIKPPQVAWQMLNKKTREYSILGTLGNFSLVIGKAKSRKSFLVNIAVSTAVSVVIFLQRFMGCLPAKQRMVLYFDTEQGKYHVQLALKRICKQIGIENPENLIVFHLRSKTPQERLKLIETAIENTPDLGFVIIDGIKDLVTSINDEEQATNIASKLLKWTEQKNIHILTVLHQNKSDNNARGHIGTELINKAETVLSVSKAEGNPDISIVEPQQCRNKEPEPFAFEIIEGIPTIVEDFQIKTETNKNRFDITELESDKIILLLKEVFITKDSFSYAELVVQVKITFKNQFNKPIGDNRAKQLITICKNNDWLIQEQPKAPYKLSIDDVQF